MSNEPFCRHRDCGSSHVTKIKEGILKCLECGQISIDDEVMEKERKSLYNGPVPNTIVSTHNSIPYISEMHIVVDDPISPDLYRVHLPKPPKRQLIEYHDLPTEEQYWRMPERPWYWSAKFIDMVAQSRWPLGKTNNRQTFDFRWWSREYDPKDARWAPITEKEAKLGGVPKEYIGRFPFQEMQDYYEREWDRRMNGYWFFNNGIATYITGSNYFYLAHFILEEGQEPEFRYLQWKIWNFVEYQVKSDNKCMGLQNPKNRRMGVTGMAACDLLESTTRSEFFKSGIVSKTEPDAEKVITRMNLANNNLVAFFKPIQAVSKNAKKEIAYRSHAGRITTSMQAYSEDEDSINSFIDISATTNSPFDGQKRQRILFDEPGKITTANVETMWAVMRECMRQGPRRTGWAWVVSTVEELEVGGGRNFMQLSEESRQTTANAFSCSKSGLKRLFIPSDEGIEAFIDQYGVCIADRPNEKQLANLKRKNPLEDYTHGLGATAWVLTQHELGSKGRRKFPLKYMDCFIADGDGCIFNERPIIQTIEYLDSLKKEPYVRGNFDWDNGIPYSNVVWRPSTSGLWKLKLPQFFMEQKLQNAVLRIGYSGEHMYRPANEGRFVVGVDPQEIGGRKTKDRSNTAAYVYVKHDIKIDPFEKSVDDWQTECFAAELLYRFPTVEAMWDEMVKVCWFFGCPMAPETNKGMFLIKHFNDNGMNHFIADAPIGMNPAKMAATYVKADKNPKKGIFSGGNQYGKTSQLRAQAIERYLERHVARIPFKAMLEDFLVFDIHDTEKNDASIAASNCLLDATATRMDALPSISDPNFTIFPIFDPISGEMK